MREENHLSKINGSARHNCILAISQEGSGSKLELFQHSVEVKDGWRWFNARHLRKRSRLHSAPYQLPPPARGERDQQQHLAAQQGMGATFQTPRTLNMVLSPAEALITYRSLAAGSDSLSYPRTSRTDICWAARQLYIHFPSLLVSFFNAFFLPSLFLSPFYPSPLLLSPVRFLGEMICKDLCFIVRSGGDAAPVPLARQHLEWDLAELGAEANSVIRRH